MDYIDLLRRLAIHDVQIAEDGLGKTSLPSPQLDPKAMSLVRLGALIAVGGAGPSYGAAADDAITAGATTDEIVDVLVGVLPVVGLPRVVAAAPKLALALGHDVSEFSFSRPEGERSPAGRADRPPPPAPRRTCWSMPYSASL